MIWCLAFRSLAASYRALNIGRAAGRRIMESASTESVKRVGIGVSMILAWLLFALGFAIHPPQSTSGAEQLRVIVATSGRWDLAHVLILVSLVLFIPVVVGVMGFLQQRGAWLGLIGGAFVAIGVVFFAAWVGARDLYRGGLLVCRRTSKRR